MLKSSMRIIGRTALILAAAGIVCLGVYAMGQTSWGADLVFALRPVGTGEGLDRGAGLEPGQGEGLLLPPRPESGGGEAMTTPGPEAPGEGHGQGREHGRGMGRKEQEGGPGRPAALNEGLAIVVRDLAKMAAWVVAVVLLLRVAAWWGRRRRAAAALASR